MKFPSFNELVRQALSTIKRFPVPIIISFIAAILAIYINQNELYKEKEIFNNLTKIAVTCVLGISFFFSINIYFENNKKSKIQFIIIQILSLLLLYGHYKWLNFDSDQGMIRYALYFIGFHLLSSVAAYFKNGTQNEFWNFNKAIFLRILLTGLFSIIIFAGLSLAMQSTHLLFNVAIKNNTYFSLLLGIFGFFNTRYFLSGVPDNYSVNNLSEINYPKALKSLVQFVLIPITIIYFIILYAYSIKILVTWKLPNGWVTHLVVWYSVIGIFVNLISHPLKALENQKWVTNIINWFYRLLFPLLILMAIAIWTRIIQYGITEDRYFIIIINIWLFIITLYFIFSKEKNIKIIPFTLFILCFLISFGPWGAFSVSLNSQTKRLENLLSSNKIVQNGIYNKNIKIKYYDKEDVISIINYLNNFHGKKQTVEVLKSFGKITDIYPKIDTMTNWDLSHMFYSLKVIESLDEDNLRIKSDFIILSNEKWDLSKNAIKISNYDFMNNLYYRDTIKTDTFITSSGNLIVKYSQIDSTILLIPKNDFKNKLKFNFVNLMNKFKIGIDKNQVSQDNLTLVNENNTIKAKLMFNYMEYYHRNNENKPRYTLEGYIIFSWK